MSSSPRQPPPVECLEVRRLHLVEAAAPPVPSGERAAMDRVWDEAVRTNPALFDGPVVACAGLTEDGPGSAVLSWARTTYRRYALRRVPGATARLPSLSVAVLQPAEDGTLLVGRMAPWTSSPGRWQLPGGSVEPPGAHEPLDEAALRRHAARELQEEVGIGTAPEALTRWLVTRGATGNVVVHFLAPALPAALVLARRAALTAAERAAGSEPELAAVALAGSPADLERLDGPRVDYLDAVLARWAAGRASSNRSSSPSVL